MLKVFFTVDVEVWCGGWHDLDSRFPEAFKRYVYGPTSRGDCGLPLQLKLLADHGLRGVFFVEPLFSARFGSAPLQEIVGLIRDGGQEVQMHLHPEWVDEIVPALAGTGSRKLPNMSQFSLSDQRQLIAEAKRRLQEAGAHDLNAFRAGSFGFNRDTLIALRHEGIGFDSSYNASMGGMKSGVLTGIPMTEPAMVEGVVEVPMTVFSDWGSSLRHAQLGACTNRELEHLLWSAHESGREAFVILSHNFELLNRPKTRSDPIVVARMRRLLSFLDRHRDCFEVSGFKDCDLNLVSSQPPPLRSALWRTGLRMVEQLSRRVFS